MWVNKRWFDSVMQTERDQIEQLAKMRTQFGMVYTEKECLSEQHVKDIFMIDWLRQRVNALEKERVVLLERAAGIVLPTSEIVPSTPHELHAQYDQLPSFEDVGDDEARRLGVKHNDVGELEYVTPRQ